MADKKDYAIKARNLMNDVYHYAIKATNDPNKRGSIKRDWDKLLKTIQSLHE